MSLGPGSSVDRYVLVEPLGEGGQGAVWKARDPLAPDSPCALKLVSTTGARPADLERARREARALAALDHPSLVQCRGLFEDLKSGVLGISMELVVGTSVRELIDEKRFGTAERQRVLVHVARALAHLHANGIVHRDVKLENVLVRDSFWSDPDAPGSVKLVDLGIAAVRGADAQLTALGTIVGTLPYLAPEQIDPATFGDLDVAPTLDVFAFGVMGWLLLAGRHPTGLTSAARLSDFSKAYRAAIELGARWPEHRPDDRMGDVLARALTLAPNQRPPDGTALMALLSEGPAAVLRPSSGGAGAATSVATPRAMHEPTQAQQQPDLAHADTASITPQGAAKESSPETPKSPRRDYFGWVVAGTLVVAGGSAYVAATTFLGSDAPRPEPSASTKITNDRPHSATPVAATSDAATDAPDAEAEAEASAPVAGCAHGCASGRDCGEAGCDATLDPTEGFQLRVGSVIGDEAGRSLFGTYRTAEVCLAVTGVSKRPVCTPLAEMEDGGVTQQALYVTTPDLFAHGLDVTIQNVIPGQGTAELASKKALSFPDGIRRKVLCEGLVVTALEGLPEARIRLFLDDAESTAVPERCPSASSP